MGTPPGPLRPRCAPTSSPQVEPRLLWIAVATLIRTRDELISGTLLFAFPRRSGAGLTPGVPAGGIRVPEIDPRRDLPVQNSWSMAKTAVDGEVSGKGPAGGRH